MTQARHILLKPLSTRAARDVARDLKAIGYRITIADCVGRSPVDVANFCEPIVEGRESERAKLFYLIVHAAQLSPRQLKLTPDNIEYLIQFVH